MMNYENNQSCIKNIRNKSTIGKIRVISSARDRAFRRKINGKFPSKPKNKSKYAQKGCRVIEPMYM